MAQWPVCSAQKTDTDVKASSDGSGWGSSSEISRGERANGANRLNRTGHTYGSCKGKDAQGYGRAETKVQAETLTVALVAQSCRALALAVVVTAAAEAEKLKARQRLGEEMKGVKIKHPLPSSYRTTRGSRMVFSLQFRYYSEFGSACITFCNSKNFNLNISTM